MTYVRERYNPPTAARFTPDEIRKEFQRVARGVPYATVVDVRDFGALLNGATDDAAAIQSAFTAAQDLTTGGIVYIPPGTAVIGTMLTLDRTKRPIIVTGAAPRVSILKCKTGVSLAAVIKIGSTTGSGGSFSDVSFTGNVFRNFCIDGNNAANRGIYSTQSNHTLIDTVRVIQTTVAGISLGYGWCNDVLNSNVSFNSGDGIVFNIEDAEGGNNNCTVRNCRVHDNNGVGVKFMQGLSFQIDGCDFERNLSTAIYIGHNSLGGNITGNYFETNASTGYVFAPPAVTIHADIIVNGSAAPTTMNAAYPAKGLLVKGNFVSTGTGNETEFLFPVAAQGLQIMGNTLDWVGGGTPSDLVRYYADPTYASVTDVHLGQNGGSWTKEVNVVSIAAFGVSPFRRWLSSSVPQHNFAEIDFLRWSLVSLSGGGTFRRSSTFYRNWPVWEIIHTSGAQSDFWGFSLNIANYPELQNKTLAWGMWAQVSVGGNVMEVVADAGGNASSNAFESGTSWKWIETCYTTGASGTINFTVRGEGLAAGRIVRFTLPVLGVVGTHMERVYPQEHNRQWWGSAIPTAGTWVLGDVIWNTAVTLGGALGWVCTTAGAPGTWTIIPAESDLGLTTTMITSNRTIPTNTSSVIAGPFTVDGSAVLTVDGNMAVL